MGVNKHRLEKEEEVDVLSIDNSKVIAVQVHKSLCPQAPLLCLTYATLMSLCTTSDDAYHYFMQKAKLEKLYGSRDQSAVDAALSALTDCAAGKGGNLLDLSIKAARVRCTVGEISDAMEKVD